MTFEEFFSKKRIDLPALQSAQPALFAEFKTHYEQMGEKSFDHTKKYWFNKIRREHPLAVEIKTEKVHIENALAEQTITETLTEATASSPKLGFTPKFRAGSMPKPAAATPAEEPKSEEQPATTSSPKLGFTPKFRAGSMPKPAATTPAEEPKSEEQPATTPSPKLGFTPKFRAESMPKPAAATPAEEPKSEEQPATTPSPKLGFTPKFRAGSMPKPAAETPSENKEETQPAPPEETAPKPAYKPRFNPKNIPKKEGD